MVPQIHKESHLSTEHQYGLAQDIYIPRITLLPLGKGIASPVQRHEQQPIMLLRCTHEVGPVLQHSHCQGALGVDEVHGRRARGARSINVKKEHCIKWWHRKRSGSSTSARMTTRTLHSGSCKLASTLTNRAPRTSLYSTSIRKASSPANVGAVAPPS